MKYPQIRQVHIPVPVEQVPENNSARMIIIVVMVVVGSFLFLGTLAIALGLGLGFGLGGRSGSSTPKFVTTTVSCNSSIGQGNCSNTTNHPAPMPIQSTSTSTLSTSSSLLSSSTLNTWPWIVALYSDSFRICTGFLLSKQHVLTTASCVSNLDKNKITIYAGITTLSTRNNAQIRSISRITYPLTYTTNNAIDDIAILTLNETVILSSTTNVCQIANDITIPHVKQQSVVVGWNKVLSTSSLPDIVQSADVEVQSPSACGIVKLSNSRFCGSYMSAGSCPGDKGSPLMTRKNNAWICSGIVNDDRSGCEFRGIYTRVSHYNKFIKSVITQ
ncbi:unnamed protein product [Adineta steineri]|uniref:Peptidase S1 domain-containing protein n=1 Tax=Adineta steineri TaxID=433720 RepID=A0A814K2A6_9BILA|nr:unnamed protein product [Adineta steineri]CAF3570657.1 unnamed protein product [Adineta steineri]